MQTIFTFKALPKIFGALSILLLLSSRISFAQTIIYQSNFNSGINGRTDASGVPIAWSTNVTVPPDGAPIATTYSSGSNSNFLGRFGHQIVTLHLSNLPKHDSVTISFDYYAIGSWDGNDPMSGPDIWGFRFDEGDTLINSTFANMYTSPGQTYPQRYDPANIINNPMKTGSELNDALGISSFGDAIYHFTFVVPDQSDTMSLNFISDNTWSGGDDIREDETWGIDSIIVSFPNCYSSLSEQTAVMVQSGCQAVDTFIHLEKTCGQVTLDSAWLDGSRAFLIPGTNTLPRPLAALDSIPLSYQSTQGPDTAYLHLRYDLGSGARDTAIMVIGRLASPFLAEPERLHREAASAYYGTIDTLPLAIDINSAVNLDSLWPYLTDISATYAWDSSIVSCVTYQPPPGWMLTSLLNRGDAVDFSIHNSGSTAAMPLALGTSLFQPASTTLQTSWVTLPNLAIRAGGQTLSLCVTYNEDNHWSVKTLGTSPSSVRVAGTPPSTQIEIYPNPVGNELFVRNPGVDVAAVTIYDALGRAVARASIAARVTATLGVHSISSGVYIARIICGSAASSHVIVKQ
ncbi:MAG TPA: T9SS type A sorting domain-containing protein [Candidatus Kapabacteria bacterium]|nr:T9SS type A sorting domain-containing protein [Candidatus Kapabacteria bacterium]